MNIYANIIEYLASYPPLPKAERNNVAKRHHAGTRNHVRPCFPS